uniref:(northern house mosquito) hypothetical protein n=1 Tax=Culex pipiens TaxID=7175 RepID=A0A8D8JHW1_CULPI
MLLFSSTLLSSAFCSDIRCSSAILLCSSIRLSTSILLRSSSTLLSSAIRRSFSASSRRIRSSLSCIFRISSSINRRSSASIAFRLSSRACRSLTALSSSSSSSSSTMVSSGSKDLLGSLLPPPSDSVPEFAFLRIDLRGRVLAMFIDTLGFIRRKDVGRSGSRASALTGSTETTSGGGSSTTSGVSLVSSTISSVGCTVSGGLTTSGSGVGTGSGLGTTFGGAAFSRLEICLATATGTTFFRRKSVPAGLAGAVTFGCSAGASSVGGGCDTGSSAGVVVAGGSAGAVAAAVGAGVEAGGLAFACSVRSPVSSRFWSCRASSFSLSGSSTVTLRTTRSELVPSGSSSEAAAVEAAPASSLTRIAALMPSSPAADVVAMECGGVVVGPRPTATDFFFPSSCGSTFFSDFNWSRSLLH